MSIGNIHSSIRNKPTNNCWILVAQLPIPPSCKKFKEATDAETRALDRRAQKEGRSDEWKKIKRGNSAHDKDGVTRAEYERIFQKMKANALGCVIRDIFAPLGSYTSASTGIDLECADGNRRRGFPVVAGWLADFQEYNKLYTTTTNGCCLCEVSPAQLGDNFIASRRCWKRHTEALQTRSWLKDRQLLLNRASDDPSFHQLCVDREELMFPARKQDLTKEKTKISKQITLADTYFEARQSKPIDNALWKTGVADMADAWKPDLLHTIYEGMFSHLLTVLQPFLYEHRRLGRFEEAWMRVPAFEGISAPKRSLFEEDQRTGKAMRENLRRILPTLVVALADPNIQEAFPFYECIAATRYLVDFSLICTYQFHTETSLGYLKTYLEGFHKHKHVFDTHRPTPRADKQKNVVHEGESDPNQRFREMEPGVDKEKQDLESRREIAKERAKKARNQLQLDAKRIMESGDMEKLKAWLGECDGEDGDEVWRFEPEAILKEIDRIATNIEARYLDHGACWKIPKLHLLSHFIETIEKFGYLQQYSSEIGETLHKGIKEAYRHSNKRDETKQILQFHTRRFAIRMRELNLLHLARQQQHEEDIQEALSLYADKRDKLLVAKLNREGKGSIRDTGYFEEKLQALRLDEAEADINVPHTDAPISLHNAIPLFGDKVVERVGHTLKSRVRAAGFKTVADVSKSYEIPKLTDAILHFLCTEKQEEYGAAGLAPEHLEDVRTEVFHSLIITDRPAQTGGALVSYRADCKGPGFRNDSVAYIDEEGDDYSIEVEERRNHGAGEDHDSCSMEIDMVKRKELGTDFGNVRVGFLQCILRLQMPLPQYLDRFKIAGASICGPEQCGVIDVVYLDPLQPVRYDMFGEMIPGAFIAKCCWPKKTKATKKWKEPPPCTVRRRNGGLVISIDSVLKNVQLLPVHGRDVVNRSQQAWLVNNRIDLHCWDILYAKKLERDENTFGIEGIVG